MVILENVEILNNEFDFYKTMKGSFTIDDNDPKYFAFAVLEGQGLWRFINGLRGLADKLEKEVE